MREGQEMGVPYVDARIWESMRLSAEELDECVGAGSVVFFFSSRRRHTRYIGDWSSDVCSSDLRFAVLPPVLQGAEPRLRVGGQAVTVPAPKKDAPPRTAVIGLRDGRWTYLGALRSEERRVGKARSGRGGPCPWRREGAPRVAAL